MVTRKLILLFIFAAVCFGQSISPAPGGGASPAGSAGCVQLYGTSTTFVCDTAFLDIAASHLVEIGGAPITPFPGLFVGVDESTLPALLQGYTTPATFLSVRKYTNTQGINIGAEFSGGGAGMFVVGESVTAGLNPFGYEADMYSGVDNSGPLGYYSFCSANGFHAKECDNFWVQTPDATGGLDLSYAYFAASQGGAATNAFLLWGDDDGVYAIHAINTFNSVYQDRPALYNPQVSKFTPTSANFERGVEQWASNRLQNGTEAGGTGTQRPVDQIGANQSIVSGTSPVVTNTTANSCGTTAATLAGNDNVFKVTVGATAGTSCTVTFATAFINAPSCTITNETTANLVRATSTTTAVVLAGTFVAGDKLATLCFGK